MSEKVYSFTEQLEKGMEGEEVLDQYFSKWYRIKHASIDEQVRDKLDRWFQPKHNPDSGWISVDYKTDDKADKTGNLFIETMSMVEMNKPGWAWASKAMKVIYYTLPDTVYILDMDILRNQLVYWHSKKRKQRTVKNEMWSSRGFIIPTKEIVQLIGEKNVRIIP